MLKPPPISNFASITPIVPVEPRQGLSPCSGPPLHTLAAPLFTGSRLLTLPLVILALSMLVSNGLGETPNLPALADRARHHWAFQPLPAPLAPSNPETNLVDQFIIPALHQHHLQLSPEASPRTLIRRVALVLTGLPPTPAEIETFLHDNHPDAYARMVDRYLASPRWGERWAKHWLDAAGYADSNGYFNADTDRPLAYRYRDYVVRSLNQDKPYPRFIQEQLAGDELTDWKPGQDATPQIIELLEATHYLRNGQDGSGESDGNPDEVRVDRYYALESSLQIMGSSLLGITVQCAKCHDHKFEPFTQKDYYSLQAFVYPAFHIDKWLKPNDRIIQAALPGEQKAWETLEKNLNDQEAELLRNQQSWIAQNRPAGKRLFHDDFESSQVFTQRWSATAPGDDSPGGSPEVKLLSDQGPSAQIQDGHLQIREGGGSGDRWISTRQSFPWLPPKPISGSRSLSTCSRTISPIKPPPPNASAISSPCTISTTTHPRNAATSSSMDIPQAPAPSRSTTRDPMPNHVVPSELRDTSPAISMASALNAFPGRKSVSSTSWTAARTVPH